MARIIFYQTRWFAIEWKVWDSNLDNAINDFNDNAKLIKAYVKYDSWYTEVLSELWEDLSLIFFALIMIFIYLLMFLGSMSPLHCRIIIVGTGLVCIGVACAAGFGLCF